MRRSSAPAGSRSGVSARVMSFSSVPCTSRMHGRAELRGDARRRAGSRSRSLVQRARPLVGAGASRLSMWMHLRALRVGLGGAREQPGDGLVGEAGEQVLGRRLRLPGGAGGALWAPGGASADPLRDRRAGEEKFPRGRPGPVWIGGATQEVPDVEGDRARRRPVRPRLGADAGPRRTRGDGLGARPGAGPREPRAGVGGLGARRRRAVPAGALHAAARAPGARRRAARRARRDPGGGRRRAALAAHAAAHDRRTARRGRATRS